MPSRRAIRSVKSCWLNSIRTWPRPTTAPRVPNQAFADSCTRLGHLMARDPGIRMAFTALGGWDTHVNEGSAEGQLANHLRPLGDGLLSLVKGLGGGLSANCNHRDVRVWPHDARKRQQRHQSRPRQCDVGGGRRFVAARFTGTGRGWPRRTSTRPATLPSPPISAWCSAS